MDTEIIVALIGFAGVIGTQWLITKRQNTDLMAKIEKNSELQDQKLDAKIEKMQAVTDTKLVELTREVREHNNFARRVPVLEEKVNALERRAG